MSMIELEGMCRISTRTGDGACAVPFNIPSFAVPFELNLAAVTTMFTVRGLIFCIITTICVVFSTDKVRAAPARTSPVEVALTSTSQSPEELLAEVARRLNQAYLQPPQPQLRSGSVPRIMFERLKKKLSREHGKTKIMPEVIVSAPHSSPGSQSPEN